MGQWKEKRFRDKVNDRILHVTEVETEEKCWKISMMAVTLVPELRCNHEEADTRMLSNAQHAGGKCVLHAVDTGAASWTRPKPRQVLLKEIEGSKE